MFCPNFKCGTPLSISTECEACGWKAHRASAKPLPFQVVKAEKAAARAERRAENEAYKAEHKTYRIEGGILEVTKEQIEGGRSYDKKTVVTMTDGRKYELHPRFPSMNDARTAELVESFSEQDWVCVKEADEEVEVVEVEENVFVGKTKEQMLELLAPKMAAMLGKKCVKKHAGDVYDVDSSWDGLLLDMLSWIAPVDGADHYKGEHQILADQIRSSAFCWVFDELGVSQDLYDAAIINSDLVGVELPQPTPYKIAHLI